MRGFAQWPGGRCSKEPLLSEWRPESPGTRSKGLPLKQFSHSMNHMKTDIGKVRHSLETYHAQNPLSKIFGALSKTWERGTDKVDWWLTGSEVRIRVSVKCSEQTGVHSFVVDLLLLLLVIPHTFVWSSCFSALHPFSVLLFLCPRPPPPPPAGPHLYNFSLHH